MTIIETIQTSLGEDVTRSYDGYVRQAAQALQDREDRIKAELRRYATGRGLSSREVDTLFERVGFDDRVLATTAQESHENASALARLASELSQQVADLNRRIQNL